MQLKEKIEMLHQREASADEEKESFESLEEEVHQKQLAVDRATAEREEFVSLLLNCKDVKCWIE